MLIDTHILVWAASAPELLSERMRDKLSAGETDLEVSIISLFEIVIKQRIGKLEGFEAAKKWMADQSVALLPMKDMHLRQYLEFKGLPAHKDPYDLFLMSVAISERLPLATADHKILESKLADLQLIDARK